MRGIEKYQVRKIYAIGHTIGITGSGAEEDELHVLIGGLTGKDSVKALTYTEACAVIGRLEELQGKSVSPKPAEKRRNEYRENPGGITTGQQKKVWALMYELKKHDTAANDVALGDRLRKIIKKELHVDATAREPFAWLDFGLGNKLIEILKKYVESAERKSEVRDGINA